MLRTEDGMPPRGPEAIGVGEWQRVWKLADVENLYDLGFWDNLWDVCWPRYGVRYRAEGEDGGDVSSSSNGDEGLRTIT